MTSCHQREVTLSAALDNHAKERFESPFSCIWGDYGSVWTLCRIRVGATILRKRKRALDSRTQHREALVMDDIMGLLCQPGPQALFLTEVSVVQLVSAHSHAFSNIPHTAQAGPSPPSQAHPRYMVLLTEDANDTCSTLLPPA